MLHVCFLDLCSLACCSSSYFLYYAGLPPVPRLLKEQLCPGLLYAPPCHHERGVGMGVGAGALRDSRQLWGRTCVTFPPEVLVSRLGQDPPLWQEKSSRDYQRGFLLFRGDSGLFISFSIYRAIPYMSEEKGSIFPSLAIII